MTDNTRPLDLHEPWAFQPELCPCDVEFCEWFWEHSGGAARVFHLGPGNHHYVGIEIGSDPRNSNVVTALTLSPAEVVSWIELLRHWPDLQHRYQVIFGDLYRINRRMLPLFTIATLFHVGETNRIEPRPDEILGAIVDLISATNGPLLFYAGSSAWDRVEPVLRRLVNEGRLTPQGEYKHLRIYR